MYVFFKFWWEWFLEIFDKFYKKFQKISSPTFGPPFV